MCFVDVLELELLHHIGDPAFAEAFPGHHVDAARTEQRPERHFNCTRIGSWHNADAVVCRHFKHFARQRDGLLEAGLAFSRTVRAAKRCVLRRSGVQPGIFAQGPEENCARVRLGLRLRIVMLCSILTDGLAFGGES